MTPILQPDINAKMRSILIDWLVDVHLKFKLKTETLYVCINLIDRYLSKVSLKQFPNYFFLRIPQQDPNYSWLGSQPCLSLASMRRSTLLI